MPYRLMGTELWDDARFCALRGVAARAVFLRLVLGAETTAAGASRVHARRIAADLDLDVPAAVEAVGQLVAEGLVRDYGDGWLWLPAFIRHQARGGDFIRSARRSVKDAPPSLKRAVDRALEAHTGAGAENTNATTPRQNRDKKGRNKQGERPPGGGPGGGPTGGPGGGPTREKGQGQGGPEGLAPPSETSERAASASAAAPDGAADARGGGNGRIEGPPRAGVMREAREILAGLTSEGRATVAAVPRRCERCGWAIEGGGGCERCETGRLAVDDG